VNRGGQGTAPYFRREDYAGFWRRLLVDLVDGFVVSGICTAATFALWGVFPSDRMALNASLALWIIVAFLYFVVLKRSPIGTLGYRAAGVRIIGLDGLPARPLALTLRLAYTVLGPLSPLDLVWLVGDPHRQALRDKFTETYVVKRKAQPIGTGTVVYRYYEIWCYNFIIREIEAERAAPST
jgi:uncharacterized RDD family membrane protein YckC